MSYKLRDYQQKALDDTIDFIENSKKKAGVVVMPTGCLTGDTLTKVTNGDKTLPAYTLEELYKAWNCLNEEPDLNWEDKSQVQIRSLLDDGIGFQAVEDVVCSGEKEVLELTMFNGKSLKLTPEHQVLTYDGWFPASECLDKLIARDDDGVSNRYSFVKCLKVEKLGVRPTYDIACPAPHHNFIANGFVVHNSGKSLSIAETVKYLRSKGEKVLILQPSKEILEQNYAKYISYGGEASICSASLDSHEIGDATFATMGTLVKFLPQLIEEGFKYVIIDECFLGETEILTNEGFKRFDKLNRQELIAQWDDEEIKFVTPERFIRKDYKGKGYKLTLPFGTEVAMTEHHDQTVYQDEGYTKVEIGKLDLEKCYIPMGGYGTGRNTELTAKERIEVLTVLFGTTNLDSEYNVMVSLAAGKASQRFQDLCSEAHIPFKQLPSPLQKTCTWVYKFPFYRTFEHYFDLDMGDERALDFLDEIDFWNNNKDEGRLDVGNNGYNLSFASAVATLGGYSCHIEEEVDEVTKGRKFFIRLDEDYLKRGAEFKITPTEIDEKVYCVTVPSGNIVLRQGGEVFVSGNCHYKAAPGKTTKTHKKKDKDGNVVTDFFGNAQTETVKSESQYTTFLKGKKGEKGLNPKKIIGFTATPIRLYTYTDKKNSTSRFGDKHSRLRIITKTVPRFFQDIIHQTPIQHLVENGYWAKLRYIHRPYDTTGLKFNSTKADFTQDSIDKNARKQNLRDRVVKDILHIQDKTNSILVFTDSIESAREMSLQVPGSAYVSAETPKKERAELVDAFKNGEIKVMFQVNVLSIGFDYPALETVMLARPIANLAVYYQGVGRLLRPSPEKEISTVIDYCGNFQRFGKLEDLELMDIKDVGWTFVSNGKVLTDVDLDSPIPITVADVMERGKRKKQKEQAINGGIKDMVFWFGKFKDQKVEDVINQNEWYIKWFVEKFEPANEKYQKFQNKVRELYFEITKQKELGEVGKFHIDQSYRAHR